MFDRNAIRVCLLGAILVVMQRSTWNIPLYEYDDAAHLRIAYNKSLTYWFTPNSNSTYFPITIISYWIDKQAFGSALPAKTIIKEDAATGSPPPLPSSVNGGVIGLRVMNALYHLIAGLFLWQFMRLITGSSGIAALVAMLWTAHPMACESVCWIAERKNVLCALFGFAALLAWTTARHRLWRWPLVNLLYTLAILSKPSALGILPVLALVDLCDPLNGEDSPALPRSWISTAERLCIPALISAIVVLANVHGHQYEIIEPPGGSILTAIMTDAEIFCRYILNIILPVNLSFFYSVRAITSIGDSRFWVFGLILVLFMWLLIAMSERTKRPLAICGVLWFFGALAPNANLIAIPFWLQDRYAYLSEPGLLLAFILAGAGLFRRLKLNSKIVGLIATSYLILMLVLLVGRSALFADPELLVLDAARRQPFSAMARLSAADVFRKLYDRAAPDGNRPDTELAARSAKRALDEYDQAEKCPDIYNFVDPFTLRIMRAEFLLSLQRFSDARHLLDGWLPPEQMKVMPEFDGNGRRIPRMRRALPNAYPRATLARAWEIAVTADLAQCTPDLTNTEKQNLCADALAASEQSLNLSMQIKRMSDNEHALAEEVDHAVRLLDEAMLLRGRALAEASILCAERNDATGARQNRDAAIKALNDLSDSSPQAAQARRIIMGLAKD